MAAGSSGHVALRGLAVLTVSTFGAAGAAGLGLPPLAALTVALDGPRPDSWAGLGARLAAVDPPVLVAGLCGGLLLVSAAWLLLVTAATVAEAVTGSTRVHLRAPALLRRLVLAGCGAALTAAAVQGPALADASPAEGGAHPATAGTATLTGLTVPDRPLGAVRARTSVTTPGHTGRAATVTVRPGDSLWLLSERLLGPGADPGAVADACRALHRANHARVGDDPDLVLPGTVLHIPNTDDSFTHHRKETP